MRIFATGRLLRMVAKSISHRFETMVETIVRWYLLGGAGFRSSTVWLQFASAPCVRVICTLQLLWIVPFFWFSEAHLQVDRHFDGVSSWSGKRSFGRGASLVHSKRSRFEGHVNP